MKDEEKTRDQLLGELAELRQGRGIEHEMAAVLDSIQEIVVHLDMDMKVLWANRSAALS